jgi:hypothetical protein
MAKKQTRPESPFVETKIDPDIAPLVKALQSDELVTLGSCSGHGDERAYIDFAVKGLRGLRRFVERLNRVRDAIDDAAWFEVSLNWDHGVVTSLDFATHPDWIMLSLTIEGSETVAPARALLAKIARLYTAAR